MDVHNYNPAFDPVKFKELMLYAAQQSVDDDKFGATKLNKILFFCDFLHYGLAGEAITGATYKRKANGPVATELPSMVRDLELNRSAHYEVRPYFNWKQRRLIADRKPNVKIFLDEERDLINDVIKNLRESNAADVSNLSHIRSRAWQIASEGEVIPYTAVFLSTRKARPSDIQRGLELARQYGWLNTAT